jgi:hypothetical protein
MCKYVEPVAIDSDGLGIWDVQHGIDDKVLVGFNKEEAQWVNIIYTGYRSNFVFNEEVYDIEDFLRLH